MNFKNRTIMLAVLALLCGRELKASEDMWLLSIDNTLFSTVIRTITDEVSDSAQQHFYRANPVFESEDETGEVSFKLRITPGSSEEDNFTLDIKQESSAGENFLFECKHNSDNATNRTGTNTENRDS